jgi:hypothetical protein
MTTMTTMTTMMTTMGSNRTRLNKSVPTSTIPRTAVIVMTQATRTRIHDLQSGGSFVLDVLAVLRRQIKTVTAVKAPDLLNDASHLLLIAILYQSITFNDRINASLRRHSEPHISSFAINRRSMLARSEAEA